MNIKTLALVSFLLPSVVFANSVVLSPINTAKPNIKKEVSKNNRELGDIRLLSGDRVSNFTNNYDKKTQIKVGEGVKATIYEKLKYAGKERVLKKGTHEVARFKSIKISDDIPEGKPGTYRLVYSVSDPNLLASETCVRGSMMNDMHHLGEFCDAQVEDIEIYDSALAQLNGSSAVLDFLSPSGLIGFQFMLHPDKTGNYAPFSAETTKGNLDINYDGETRTYYVVAKGH